MDVTSPKRYLTTLGESIHRWANDLSKLLLLISQLDSCHTPAMRFMIQVPQIATAEWRCNGGGCSSNGTAVSFHCLFPHRVPESFEHNVHFRTEQCGDTDRKTQCAKTQQLSANESGCSPKLETDPHSFYETAVQMITVQPSGLALQSSNHVEACTAALGANFTEHERVYLADNSMLGKCGHVFLRRPIITVGGHLYALMHNLSSTHHAAFTRVPLRHIGRVIRAIAAKEGVRCLELNYDHDRSRVTSHDVIYALNNGSHGQIPVHHLKRPKGTAPNAWSMKRAVRASMLITELGTQWTDFPMEKRCALGRRSFVLAVAPNDSLLHYPVSCNSARVPQYGCSIPFSRGQDPSMNWCEQSLSDSGIAARYCQGNFSSQKHVQKPFSRVTIRSGRAASRALNNTGLQRSSPRPRLLPPLLQSLPPLEPNAQTELREVWAG